MSWARYGSAMSVVGLHALAITRDCAYDAPA